MGLFDWESMGQAQWKLRQSEYGDCRSRIHSSARSTLFGLQALGAEECPGERIPMGKTNRCTKQRALDDIWYSWLDAEDWGAHAEQFEGKPLLHRALGGGGRKAQAAKAQEPMGLGCLEWKMVGPGFGHLGRQFPFDGAGRRTYHGRRWNLLDAFGWVC